MLQFFPVLTDFLTLFYYLLEIQPASALVFSFYSSLSLLILFFLKKKKKTPEEKERQAIMDQQYILEKIRSLQHQRDAHLASQSITNMPMTFTPV